MKLRGVFTALVTPMKNGEVDIERLLALARRQVSEGISGLVLTGTTGEAATLSAREKTAIYSSVVREFKGKTKIIAGTGCNNTATTIENSIAAMDCGVDALLVVTPYYNRPSQEGLERHFSEVAAKVSLPLILYNVPGRTGVNMPPGTVRSLSEIENVVAIKEAGTFKQMNDMIRLNGDRVSILSGDDFTFMPFMALGGDGVISVVSNIVPAKMVSLFEAIGEKDLDLARKIHFEIYPLIEVLFIESNPGPVKAALSLMGHIENEVRLPLVAPRVDSTRRIREVLFAGGFLRGPVVAG